MKDEALPHLLNEVDRGDVVLCHANGRYADSWHDKNKRKIDIILRITRTLVKC